MTSTRAAKPAVTTRTDLIEAGTSLILEKGYNNSGLDEILKAAGVQKGSFYYFFKNKEEFGLQVVDAYAEKRLAQLDRDLGDTEHRPINPSSKRQVETREHEDLYEARIACAALDLRRGELGVLRRHHDRGSEARIAIETMLGPTSGSVHAGLSRRFSAVSSRFSAA